METNTPGHGASRPPGRTPLGPLAAVGLAIATGLVGGSLDLLLMLGKKAFWNDPPYLWAGRDYPWSVPLAHVVLLLVPGLIVAGLNWLRPGLVSWRAAAWLFGALAIWSALLRLPIVGASALIVAIGLGRPISKAVARFGRHPRPARWTLAGLLGLLGVLAAGSTGRQAIREAAAVAALRPTPAGARNVVLIVLDTVRARNLSLYDYPRATSPHLLRWAERGIRFKRALAPAPWTYPSHSSFFTGHWPFQLNSQWKFQLDAPEPTLAEFLSGRGYQTAAFVANTNCCSYETGLNRGFLHYDDYPITPRTIVGRTVTGRWLLENIVYAGDFYARKWIGLQSRDARAINGAFSDWLDRKRPDRPFFAYLNYFDAHGPYIPPPGALGQFGEPPQNPRDNRILMQFASDHYESINTRDVLMARDRYDDCIAFLDGQLAELRAALRDRGLLEETVVIITADHGEEFGERGIFGHAKSVYLDEVAVPLVVLAPGLPAGRVVPEPVSLRDLPATVVDLLGLAAGAPFPGHSLAACWQRPADAAPPATSPALAEIANATAFQPQSQDGLGRRGFQMSLVAQGRHYVRDGTGAEHLYDPLRDPYERTDLIGATGEAQAVATFRRLLLDVLAECPGSIEVEAAYLGPFRHWLRELVRADSGPREAITASESPSTRRPRRRRLIRRTPQTRRAAKGGRWLPSEV